jgi:hypothetical protein
VTLAALLPACIQCMCSCGHGSPATTSPNVGNSVAAFLNRAERQAETDEQRAEIQRALRDMLVKPPAQLRQIRYADYAGQESKWSITELLQHYFVPNPPAALDEERFYRDVRAPAAHAAIQLQLEDVSRGRQ